MSIEIVMQKAPNGALVPATEEDAQKLATMKVGQGVKVTVTHFYNLRFHRKLFCLFRLAFDAWEPAEPVVYEGQAVAKDFQRFRKDLTILAGYYDVAPRLNGKVALEARSLAFERMNDGEKQGVYRAVLSTIWERVLRYARYENPEQVEQIVERMMGFE